MTFHTRMKTLFCLTSLLLAGCVTLTEAERVELRYERHNSDILRAEAIQAKQLLCKGLFIVRVTGSRIPNRIPRTTQCVD